MDDAIFVKRCVSYFMFGVASGGSTGGISSSWRWVLVHSRCKLVDDFLLSTSTRNDKFCIQGGEGTARVQLREKGLSSIEQRSMLN